MGLWFASICARCFHAHPYTPPAQGMGDITDHREETEAPWSYMAYMQTEMHACIPAYIHVHAYMYIMYTIVHVCALYIQNTYIHMHIHMHIHKHIRTYIRSISSYLHTHMPTYIHTYVRAAVHAYRHQRVCIYIHTYLDMSRHISILIYAYTGTFAFTITNIQQYIYAYIHTYTHGYMRTNIHT